MSSVNTAVPDVIHRSHGWITFFRETVKIEMELFNGVVSNFYFYTKCLTKYGEENYTSRLFMTNDFLSVSWVEQKNKQKSPDRKRSSNIKSISSHK